MPTRSQPRRVLFVGSVPLPSATAVFEAIGKTVGDLAPRIPDGETGGRLRWIGWQREQLRHVDGLELVGEQRTGGPVPQALLQFRLKEGHDPASLRLHPLGYADAARQSYLDFKHARSTGAIPSATRFQISLPSALALAIAIQGPLAPLVTAFETALAHELRDIFESVPAEDAAIQWDLAIETEQEEGERHPEARGPLMSAFPHWSLDEAVRSVAVVSAEVPAAAELGMHLCYGDPDGKHIIEPHDASVMVDVANALAAATPRPINWVHMPVPIARDDSAYFAPLEKLDLNSATELYLGLVHHDDGVAGAAHRIAAARRVVPTFGVATECGLGRRDPNIIPDLLRLHREIAYLD